MVGRKRDSGVHSPRGIRPGHVYKQVIRLTDEAFALMFCSIICEGNACHCIFQIERARVVLAVSFQLEVNIQVAKRLVVTEISPRVKGVVVVCEGGANPITIKRVTDAVTTALGINSLQVCVAKASK